MTKVLFGALVMMGCAMAAAAVVFATPEPLPAVPASSSSCPGAAE